MNLRVRPTTTLPDVVAVALPRSSTTGSIRFPFPCFDDQNARRANTLMHHRSLPPSYFPRQHKVADGTRLSLTLAVLFVSFRFLHDTQDSCPPISRPAAVVAAYLHSTYAKNRPRVRSTVSLSLSSHTREIEL